MPIYRGDCGIGIRDVSALAITLVNDLADISHVPTRPSTLFAVQCAFPKGQIGRIALNGYQAPEVSTSGHSTNGLLLFIAANGMHDSPDRRESTIPITA
jgi:hypothetical protein